MYLILINKFTKSFLNSLTYLYTILSLCGFYQFIVEMAISPQILCSFLLLYKGMSGSLHLIAVKFFKNISFIKLLFCHTTYFYYKFLCAINNLIIY